MTTTGGSVVHQARFLPFGGPRTWGSAPTTAWLDRGYTGHLHNDEVGLIYMNARYYVPSLGRFASADTIVPDPTNPQQFNRFSYVLNNPLRFTDPTGHLSEDEINNYFGFATRQEMLDAHWSEELVNWLWDPAVNWGDTFTYNDGEGVAILAMFEAVTQDSGIYRGGFWGLVGNRVGEEVYMSRINSLDDHTEVAISQEEKFFNNWETLPRQTGSDGYNNYDPTTYVDALTVGTVSASVSIGGLCFISGPIGWSAGIAAGIAVTGGATAVYSIATDTLTYNYPILRLPSISGNAPRTWHTTTPRGFYE
jgi:RHS repeat-associated protein